MDERIRRIVLLMGDRASIGEAGFAGMYGPEAATIVDRLMIAVMDRLKQSDPGSPAVRRFESSPDSHGLSVMALLNRQMNTDAAFANRVWELYHEFEAEAGAVDAVSGGVISAGGGAISGSGVVIGHKAQVETSWDDAAAAAGEGAVGYGPPPGPPTIPDKPI